MDNSEKVRYFAAIGQIAAYSNVLERQIFKYIQSVGRLDKNTAFYMLAGEDAGMLLKIFDIVVRTRLTDPNILSEFLRLRKRISKLIDQRNTYIHSVWEFPPNSKLAVSSKTTRKKLGDIPKFLTEEISVDILDRCSSDFVETTLELAKFCMKQFPTKSES